MKKKCLHCTGSLAGRGRAAKFCSEACVKAYRTKVARKRVEAAWKTRPCKRCGNPFRSHPNQFYCGDECTLAATRDARNARYRRQTQKARFCSGCGDQFPPGTHGSRQFCSSECRLGGRFVAEEVFPPTPEVEEDRPAPKQPRKLATAAPGCADQCGTCISCRLFLALQDSAAKSEARSHAYGLGDDDP